MIDLIVIASFTFRICLHVGDVSTFVYFSMHAQILFYLAGNIRNNQIINRPAQNNLPRLPRGSLRFRWWFAKPSPEVMDNRAHWTAIWALDLQHLHICLAWNPSILRIFGLCLGIKMGDKMTFLTSMTATSEIIYQTRGCRWSRERMKRHGCMGKYQGGLFTHHASKLGSNWKRSKMCLKLLYW
jgi:hypothetical protein